MSTPRNWIAVASAEHARRGRDQKPVGFMQVGHGKRAPLTRIAPGDRVAYYAPATTLKGTDKLQSFVSIGIVQPGEPYEHGMEEPSSARRATSRAPPPPEEEATPASARPGGQGFMPWRRDVRYVPAEDAPIAPLLDAFDFIDDRRHWGAKFRFGLIEINDHDMRLIADTMGADSRTLGW